MALDASIERVELSGDEEEVNSVEVRDPHSALRSWLVMRTYWLFKGEYCVHMTANVTSSAGVSEIMRRGEEGDGNSTGLLVREGTKKETGGVIV
jgi:hypothetical protein